MSAAGTRRSYDAVAGRYAAEMADELRSKPLDRALLDAFAELAGDGRVADIGCGPGHVTAYLAGRGADPFGLDLSPMMCAAALQATSLAFAAADMTALPLRPASLAGLVCLYAVIHLDAAQRLAAYEEFARVLRPGGHALVAFHTSDDDVPVGGSLTMDEWWGQQVALTFRFLDPIGEVALLRDAGLELTARLDRAPYEGAEHASQRCYLLVRRPSRP
jgi:SAM-dependent methyltransferase